MSTATEPQTRQQWLAARRTGIGASDSPSILGCGFSSAFDVFAEKAGLIDADDLSHLERIEWGNRLQRPVGDAFAERTGRKVEHWPEHEIVRHINHDWMISTPDAQQHCPHRGPGVLQIKTTSAWMAKEWEGEPPLGYQVQLQHEMEVLNAQWGSLACLIGGQKLVWFDMERNQSFIDAMIPQLQAFWLRVLAKDPPTPDGNDATRKALRKLYSSEPAGFCHLGDQFAVITARIEGIKQREKELNTECKQLETERKALENQILAEMEDAEFGYLPDGTWWERREINRKGYEVKPCTYVQLSRKVK